MTSSDQNSSVTDPPLSAPEEPPRVKLLCSFGGSILPRPLDGKLRYVGGETRIVTLPRDAGYEELAARMRELFDDGGTAGGGAADSSLSPPPAWVIKYQQPDEDLDALVSVVNDDDVTNMMEEYDKLAAAPPTEGGFTRLRVFLFSQPDIDAAEGSLHFDADDRETERRYVDALNSLPEGKNQSPDAAAGADPNRGSVAHFGGGAGEQYFVPASEVGLHGHQFNNLHRLTIPRLPSHGQLYSEVEGPWSPAATGYYSPGQGPHTPRDFPPSPSTSGRYHGGASDFGDRFPDEFVRQSPAHHQVHQYDHLSSPFVDGNSNMVWLPPGGVIGEAAGGFPGNLAHVHPNGAYDGNAAATCEHCLLAYQRQQAAATDARYHDPRRNLGLHHSHYEHSDMGGAPFSGSCTECARQAYMFNQEMKFDNGVYPGEQFEHPRPFYGDMHGHDRNWALRQHPLGYLPEDIRGYRNEQYIAEGAPVSSSIVHGSIYSESSVPSNYLGRDDASRYMRPSVEHGNGPYHDPRYPGVGLAPPPMHVPGMEEGGIRYSINPSAYGTDGLYHIPQGSSSSIHGGGRPLQGAPLTGPVYNISPAVMLQAPSATNLVYPLGTVEGSAGHTHSNLDDRSQAPWTGQIPSASQKVFPIDSNINADYRQDNTLKSNANIVNQDNNSAVTAQPSLCPPAMDNNNVPQDLLSSEPLLACPIVNENRANPGAVDILETNLLGQVNEAMQQTTQGKLAAQLQNGNLGVDLGSSKPALVDQVAEVPVAPGDAEYSMENLTFLPELIASVKKVALEGVDDKEENADDASSDPNKKEQPLQDAELENVTKVLDGDLDNDKPTMTKIEPTAAEMEALAKGLQVIRNDDLEEIRELGSGAYGSVFHGKWKGSDVAIKRIKASCFSGKPSERERLISDFWKEALILSSLHHPNVVAFYGVVRDGPGETLATVTEFMVNGSLKQFLQKKDRTIDRRKRLIIAMDAAFGMEYLHGKNIVHFDLKCENLLVNMRDPQRPVCKIGDLGLSKVKQKTLVSGGVRGTLPWMAPELLSGKSKMVTEKVDVYSFGIVMWELLTGEDPYTDMHCASIIGGIVNDTLRPQIPSWCDPEWKSLMESCWSSDSKERPSFSEISQRLRKMAAAINVK